MVQNKKIYEKYNTSFIKSVKLVFDVDYKRRGCEYILFVDWASYYKNEDTGEVEESNFKKFIIHEITKQDGLDMLVK